MDAHGRAQTLAWHRELLRRFELDLRDPAIGNKPNVTIPFWVWTDPFPRHLDDDVADDMFMGGAGNPVTTGPFRAGQWTIQQGGNLNRTNASAVNTITVA
ncbi:MAG: tyrosinase family protein, partial [bacterium]